MAAADERGARDLVKDVAEDRGRAEHIVEVDPHAPAPAETGDLVHVVVANHRAPHRPVAPGVDRAGVVGLLADVVDLVQLDHVVVAAEHEGHVRGVVDQVVRRPQAHARQRDRGLVHAIPLPVVVNVVVHRFVLGAFQRCAVAESNVIDLI